MNVMTTPILFALLLACVYQVQAADSCFQEASARYRIPEKLLKAIAQVESGNRDGITHRNQDGSTDIGRLMINDRWLPTLSKYNITKDVLLNDGCMNIQVGAWILANNFDQLGYNWEAVGAYNVGCKKTSGNRCFWKRNRYSNKVYSAMNHLHRRPSVQQADVATVSTQVSDSVATVRFAASNTTSFSPEGHF
jgi:soluble lytic murein transglycosylase-like protein